MVRTTLSILLFTLLLAQEGNQDVQRTMLEGFWPEGITLPKTMRLYDRTQYAQELTITNGIDTLRPIHYSQGDNNPNRLFPWAVNGGLHRAQGWTSRTAIAIPEGKHILYWSERIDAGARRHLPRMSWQFPVGTVVADLLFTDGELFELRTLNKTEDGSWRGRRLWRSGKMPVGYIEPDRVIGVERQVGICVNCHQRAGAWQSYGALIRGADGVFSFSVLEEGTLRPRTDFPVKHWNDR